jgi:hypothetical protein
MIASEEGLAAEEALADVRDLTLDVRFVNRTPRFPPIRTLIFPPSGLGMFLRLDPP